MNSIVVFAFLVADISALMIVEEIYSTVDITEDRSSNSIAEDIRSASQSIKDAGADPLYIDMIHFEKALPLPILFNAHLLIEGIRSSGLSNIVVHKITYSPITSRVNFNIELPLIDFSVDDASAEVTVFGSSLDVKASGRIQIQSIHIVGQVRVSVSIITGVAIHRVTTSFTLGNIISEVKLIIQGKDYSSEVNRFLGSTVPKTIKAYNYEMDKLLEIILMDLFSDEL